MRKSPSSQAFYLTVTSRWLLLLAGGTLLPLRAQGQSLNTAKLDSLLTSLATNQKMMGSVAVMRAGQVVYSRAFGFAQLRPPLAATPATRYRVNYLHQLLTTILTFQLVEEGKLTLNTPLARFLPKFPRAADITIEHLLTERSGLRARAYPPGKPMTSAQLLDFIAEPVAPAEIFPGVPYVHANYVLLEHVIAQLTKQTYAQALQTRILDRAGMHDTYFSRVPSPQQQEALAFEKRASGWQPSPNLNFAGPTGTGTLVSTPADLNRLSEALYEGRLVSAAHRQEMEQGHDGNPHLIGSSGQNSRWPQPLYSYQADLSSANDYSAMASYSPTEKLSVAFCSNARAYSINQVWEGIRSICFAKPYRLPVFTTSSYVPESADLDRCVGEYASSMIGLFFSVKREGNTLRLESPREGNMTLEPVSKGVFRYEERGARIEFAPDFSAFLYQQNRMNLAYFKR
ncbi:serine hydrolase domain-containing protein [Hymenobacter negativus]|uniref:Beta-lactamase family protein n=1 Tax=Hymenobacter negativus TaxID=2795026 RepID=A0ABS0Q324_9BACT|nr:serine hydrolase domain-containing protein [Hymenobacter negativus]MBH8556743.1 beta-lactamase family protein [Hymenobacter negativus]